MKYWLLFLFIFFCLLIPSAFSQTHYFPGRIIIKYKSDMQLSQIRAKTQTNPKNRVQQALQQAQVTRINPVWNFGNVQPANRKNPAQVQAAVNELERIYQVFYSTDIDAAQLAAKISQYAAVEYAEPQYLRKTSFIPNDPIENPYPEFHKFHEAWDITKGSSDVIIGIVDSGVNYLHEDLDAKLWVNTDEIPSSVRAQVDQNGDGTITSTEVLQYLQQQNGDYDGNGTITLEDALASGSPLVNGNDTDGNGFADDIFGWDFWESGGTQGQPVSEDNNPIINASDHGTHVTGIAAAETNNETGLAGAGFNVRYMAVKTGGIPDNPSTEVDESRLIGFGFQGIIYAALQGAEIINCSFGGGSFSTFEEDIINFATDMGSVVIASAGNESNNEVSFPSGYENTISVGAVTTSNQLASYSNYGYSLDVLATGTQILSTSYGNDYVLKSGTSMSAPVVSGLAGLIKTIHPNWSSQRIATQIRVSSTFLPTGGDTENRLGHGKINAFEALSTNKPGLRVLSSEFVDDEGNKLGLGEAGFVNITIINYGDAISSTSLELESLNQGNISFEQPTETLGGLATGESTTITFELTIEQDYELKKAPVFKLGFTNNTRNYQDFDIFTYADILFDVINANDVKMSFGSAGTVGFTNPLRGTGGVGFIPKTVSENFEEGENLLFGGGLMLTANGQVYDAVRSTGSTIIKDFIPQQVFTVTDEGTVAEQLGTATFTFENSSSGSSGSITLATYAFDEPERSSVVYVAYRFTNTSSVPLEDVYIGLFNDWDLGNIVSNNSVKFSAADSILYIRDENPDNENPLVAVAHLGNSSSLLAIDNRSSDGIVDLTDGFSDTEKQQSLKAGTSNTEVLSSDVSAVVATGPYTVNPDATLTAGFLYAFGDDLDALRNQIMNARRNAPFEVSETGLVISEAIPETTELYANYPNPFTDQTTIRIDLNEAAHVKLTVYDVLGRRIKILRDVELDAGQYFIPFNPEGLSSGVYYVQLITDNKIESIPVTYIK